MPPRGRAGFFCQSGALGSAILEKVNNRGLGLSTFVSAGNRADVSGNDLLQYWEEDDSTEVVLLYLESIGNPRKFSRIARRVSRRKPIIAVRSGRTTQGVPDGARGPQDRRARRRPSTRCSGRRGSSRSTPSTRCSTSPSCWPTSRCRAVAGSRSSATPTRSGCSPPTPPPPSGSWSTARCRSAPRPRAEDFEDALDAAIDDPDVDSVVAVYIPPLNASGEEVANVLAAVGRAVRQAAGLHLPRRRGGARAAAGARRGRPHRRPRLGAVVPRGRGRRARARARRGVRRVAAHPATGWPRAEPDERATPRGQAPGQRAAHADTPTARPGPRRTWRRCWRPTASSSGRPAASRRCGEAQEAGRGARLGRRAQGDRRAAARPSRPGPRLAQHRHRRRDAGRLATARTASPIPERPASWCRRTPRPASRWRSAASRTRCSGRWSRSASPGRSPSCSPTAPTGSRRCPSRTPPRWCGRSSPRPMLFGYRGSEVVDVERGRAADPPGLPAAARPAAGAARSTCRWSRPAPRARPC